MNEPRVFIVHLRRPSSDAGERRSDPYYEFGSFGCTRCHTKNLMHPKNVSNLVGSRLAFAQGGRSGFRLVLLTPLVMVQEWADRCEARWKPAHMPFKYEDAPLLIDNAGKSDFPCLKHLIKTTRRKTLEGGFSSRFRSRTHPLKAGWGAEIIRVFKKIRSAASPSSFASSYVDALPYDPPEIETERKRNYQVIIEKLKADQHRKNESADCCMTPNLSRRRSRSAAARC